MLYTTGRYCLPLAACWEWSIPGEGTASYQQPLGRGVYQGKVLPPTSSLLGVEYTRGRYCLPPAACWKCSVPGEGTAPHAPPAACWKCSIPGEGTNPHALPAACWECSIPGEGTASHQLPAGSAVYQGKVLPHQLPAGSAVYQGKVQPPSPLGDNYSLAGYRAINNRRSHVGPNYLVIAFINEKEQADC